MIVLEPENSILIRYLYAPSPWRGASNDPSIFNPIHCKEIKPIALKLAKIKMEEFDKFENSELTKEDVVFFCPSSLAPRDKVKGHFLKQGFGLNVTNRLKYANTFVLNHEDIKSLLGITFIPCRIVPVGDFPIKLNPTGKKMEGSTLQKVYISQAEIDKFSPRLDKLNSYPSGEAMEIGNIKQFSFIKTLSTFYRSPSSKIVYDQTILKIVNEQILDINMYENLSSMLMSSDDNKLIGTEIISNCNPEENKVALVLLMIENWEKIKVLKNTHVGFRALVEYYKTYNFWSDWRTNFNQMISEISKKSIRGYEVEMIENFLKKKVNNYLTGNVSPDSYEISGIKIKII